MFTKMARQVDGLQGIEWREGRMMIELSSRMFTQPSNGRVLEWANLNEDIDETQFLLKVEKNIPGFVYAAKNEVYYVLWEREDGWRRKEKVRVLHQRKQSGL